MCGSTFLILIKVTNQNFIPHSFALGCLLRNYFVINSRLWSSAPLIWRGWLARVRFPHLVWEIFKYVDGRIIDGSGLAGWWFGVLPRRSVAPPFIPELVRFRIGPLWTLLFLLDLSRFVGLLTYTVLVHENGCPRSVHLLPHAVYDVLFRPFGRCRRSSGVVP